MTSLPVRDGDNRRFIAASSEAKPQLRLLPSVGHFGVVGEGPASAGFDLLGAWQVLVKQRWVVAACLVAAVTIGLAITLLTPPSYTAGSTLQIDREAAKVVGTGDIGLATDDNLVEGEEFFKTQYGLLRSRSLSLRVAQALGLLADDSFVRAMGKTPRDLSPAFVLLGPDAQRQARRDQVAEILEKHLGVAPERGSRLVTVDFSSPDAKLSARIANAYADNFIGAALDRRYQSSSYARDFLERRLAEVKARLEDSERQLVAYATSQQIISVQDGGTPNDPAQQRSLQAADLESLDTALSAAEAARMEAEARWRQAQASPGLGLPEILQNPTVQKISEQHAQLVAEYQDKLSVFKPDYPDMRQLKAQIDGSERQLELAAADIRHSLEAQYDAAVADEASLQRQVDNLKSGVLDLSKRSIQYAILQREVDTNRTLYDGLLQRYKEVGVAGGVAANNISVVDRAEAPERPSAPRPLLNLAIALAAGVGLGVAAAFCREALDQAVRTAADVEEKLGAPMLGAIPLLKSGVQPPEALADPRSDITEAYQSLRSALQFSTIDGFPASLLVTSPKPGDGKSTSAFALAAAMAKLGYRTLIVDADLRNPCLHKLIGADNRTGLSNLLTGAANLAEVTQAGGAPNLYVVSSGPLPPNPAELLAGHRLKQLVGEAGSVFDVLIFDAPPIMGLADAPMIAASVAGCLVVLESGRTQRVQARAALARLALANGHILGVALTKFNAREATLGYGYGYQYDYRYGAQAQPERGLKRLLHRRKAA